MGRGNSKGSCPARFRHSLHILLILDSRMLSEGFPFRSGCRVRLCSPPCSQPCTNKENASLIPCPYNGKHMWWWWFAFPKCWLLSTSDCVFFSRHNDRICNLALYMSFPITTCPAFSWMLQARFFMPGARLFAA